MLVDDEEINLLVTEEMLKEAGATVDTVSSAKSALIRLDHENYHLILLDLLMPDMDGIELTKAIREGSVFKHFDYFDSILIICITGNNMEDEIEQCLQAGIHAIIQKPFKENELIGILKTWVEEHKNRGGTFHIN